MWSIIHEGTDCAPQLKLLLAAIWSGPSPGQPGQFVPGQVLWCLSGAVWESLCVVLGHSQGIRGMRTTEGRAKQALGESSRKLSRVQSCDFPSFNNSCWAAKVNLTLLPVFRWFGFTFGILVLGFFLVFFFFFWGGFFFVGWFLDFYFFLLIFWLVFQVKGRLGWFFVCLFFGSFLWHFGIFLLLLFYKFWLVAVP